ncbi:MAG: lysophospholipid acyltransferase family protein [Deltaproteobacteria bacterium]|nr:lysophospholipid acyltransferase family protein [Deltaproteobacteria bacterium]
MGDLRLGQPWGRAQQWRNEAWFRSATLALAGTRGLPRRALPGLGRALGTIAWATLVSWRRRAEDRLVRAYGEPPITSLDVFRGVGEDLADAVRLLDERDRPESCLEIGEDTEVVLRDALASKRGVVFVTAHLGPMERMAALVAAKGFRVATLARESYDPRFTQLYERLRSGRGIRTIYRGKEGAERRIVRALREGSLVGFPMDFAGRGMACTRCSFLGSEEPLPLGPAAIALRTGAPVVVGTPAPGEAGSLRVAVRALEVGAGWGEVELTRRLAAELEARIRALPAHWPWMHSGISPTSESSR